MFICCYLKDNGEVDCVVYDNYKDVFGAYNEWETATVFEVVKGKYNGIGRTIIRQKVKEKNV
jgi:hypothetical protein